MVEIIRRGRSATTTVDTFVVLDAPDMYRGAQKFRPESIVRTVHVDATGQTVGVVIRGKGAGGTLDGCAVECVYAGATMDDLPEWARPVVAYV